MAYEQTETAVFIDTPLFFVRDPGLGNVWTIPAPLIGYALRAEKNGLEFERRHYDRTLKTQGGFVFADGLLEELRLAYSPEAIGLEVLLAANTLAFKPSGLVNALLKSRAALSIRLRRFFHRYFYDVFTPEERKLLLPKNKNTPKKEVKHVSTKKTAKPAQKTAITLPDLPNLPKELAAPLAVLREMASTGYFKEETLADLYLDLFKRSLREADAIQARRDVTDIEKVPSTLDELAAKTFNEKYKKPDATEMVPVSNIQASSMTPNFQSVRSFFLTGGQRHPLYKEWIPAEIIGAMYGKDATWAKKYISQYVETKLKDLPNNVATEKVVRGGGWFQGVSSLVDDHQLPTYVDQDLGGLACWYLMQDGKLVWRNYWSPDAVKAIRALVPSGTEEVLLETKEPEFPPSFDTTGQGFLGAPPNGQY